MTANKNKKFNQRIKKANVLGGKVTSWEALMIQTANIAKI